VSERKRRSRGDGSVFFDASRGCWVGVLDVGRSPETGRRVRRKVSAATKTECRDKLDALKAERRRTGTVARRDVTVREVLDDFLDNPPAEIRSDITRQVNRDAALRICDGARGVRGIGSTTLARLTVGDVERVLRGLAGAGYSARSLSQSRSVLRRAIRRAERNELASRNVAELAELPAALTRKSRALTETQVRALLALKLTAWWRAFIITAVMTGMRPGELLGLRWEDVDFDSGVIRVRVSLKRVPAAGGGYQLELRDLKTERSKRTMTMPAPVCGVLTVLRRAQAADRLKLGAAYDERGLVFCGPTGRPRHNQGVRDHYRRLCKRAGIASDWDWQLRETRHTFISQLSDSGVDIERIADAAGHVNSNVTRTVYRHQLADKVSEAAGAMDQRYGSVGPS
jgi:integrase